MKNKYLGYFFIFLVIAATVSLLYLQYINNSVPQDSLLPLHQESQTSIFSDPKGQFDFKYPKTDVLVTENGPSDYFDQKTGIIVAAVQIANTVFPKTNFAESWVEFARDVTIRSAAACANYSNGTFMQPMPETETINGLTFNKDEFNDAGAGNFYETRLYRIFYNQTCFEIALTLHTGNIGNYPAGTVTEVDKSAAWSKLTDILDTFKFKN